MDKIRLRDIQKEKPNDYEMVFLWPQCLKAEYTEGHFYNNAQNILYLDVKLWCPIIEIFNILEKPSD